MDLKRRLTLANAATVIIPVIITALLVLGYVFIYTRLINPNSSFDNYQRLYQINLELLSNQSALQKTPEIIKEEGFQKYLAERMAVIEGEVLIVEDGQLLFSTRSFTKIDIEKLLDMGKAEKNKGPVTIDNTSFTVQMVEVVLNKTSRGSVLLIAPLDRKSTRLNSSHH